MQMHIATERQRFPPGWSRHALWDADGAASLPVPTAALLPIASPCHACASSTISSRCSRSGGTTTSTYGRSFSASGISLPVPVVISTGPRCCSLRRSSRWVNAAAPSELSASMCWSSSVPCPARAHAPPCSLLPASIGACCVAGNVSRSSSTSGACRRGAAAWA
jgi:hypothetical protein